MLLNLGEKFRSQEFGASWRVGDEKSQDVRARSHVGGFSNGPIMWWPAASGSIGNKQMLGKHVVRGIRQLG